MDRLDTRILRLLVQGEVPSVIVQPILRVSFRSLARAVGVDEGTVRHRVKRFYDTGLIREWRPWPNPRIWGEHEAGAWFDVPHSVSREELTERLKLIPGMMIVNLFLGSMMAVVFRYAHEQSLERRVKLIQSISETENLEFGQIPYPECEITMEESDWKLLQSLDRSVRKPYYAIAEELGLSSRTVRRRLKRLIRTHAVFLFSEVKPKALQGATMVSLMVYHSLDRREDLFQRISERLDPDLWHLFFLMPLSPGQTMSTVFNLVLPNATRAGEVLRWAQELPGVEAARVDLHEDVILLRESLDKYLRGGPGPPARAKARRSPNTGQEG